MNPPCPDCGGELVLRTGKRGEFLGCLRFPECRGSLEINGASPDSNEASSLEKKPVGSLGGAGAFLSELLGEIRSLRISVDRLTEAVSIDGANNDLNLLRHAAFKIVDELRIQNELQWAQYWKTWGWKPKGDDA